MAQALLLDRLKKSMINQKLIFANECPILNSTEFITTDIPAMNIALAGSAFGGFRPGLILLAAPSAHYKTLMALLMVAAYLKKYQEAYCVFFDSEFGVTLSYLASQGVDTSRLIHIPVTNIEDLKFQTKAMLDQIALGDKVIFLIDSIGNLASKKEEDDAADQKSVADMSRAKALKQYFRIVTPHLASKQIVMVAVNHTYQEIGMFPKTIMGGGCFGEGTLVRMADGTLKEIQDIKQGEFVKTLSGEKEVIHTWTPETLDEGEPECFEIEFEDGLTIVCSYKQTFLCEDDNGCQTWKRVDELTEHDNIVTL